MVDTFFYIGEHKQHKSYKVQTSTAIKARISENQHQAETLDIKHRWEKMHFVPKQIKGH